MRASTLLTAALIAAPCLADDPDDLLEGHSEHGEVFNEGPRQAAYLIDSPCCVHFPVTIADDELQTFFDQGVGQLHGFWYFEAERTFRHIASQDPDCPMAYWGMAMANVDNEDRAAGFARVAWLKRGLATERERMFIDALARFHEVEGAETPKRLDDLDDKKLEKEKESRNKRRKSRAQRLTKDYEEIVWEYPDDIEAKAFLVNRLWLNSYRFGLPTQSRQANEALLAQIFAVQPMHPAHHYRIHLWDADDSAERVIDSAVKSGHTNPGVAHMWHMGGHIFDKLGRWEDAAWQQEASARVDHAHMMRDRVLPDQIHNFAHNNEWLTRSLRAHGRVREAVTLAKNMIELPRHPKYNKLDKGGTSASYGRRRLLEVLEIYEQWDQLVALSRTMYLEPSDEAGDQAERAYLLGKAHAYRGDEDGFEAEVATLERLLEEAREERIADLEEAEQAALEEGETGKKVTEALTKVLEEHQKEHDRLREKIEALAALRAAIAGEELDDNLKILRKRGFQKAHLARLCLAAGEDEDALELAREAAKSKQGRVYFEATLAHVLHETGATEEALELFDELREVCARADIDLPVFQRLAPLAEARGLPADWRPEPSVPADVSGRPDLDDLGPLRWTPPEALAWTCPDGFGGEVSLSDYRGRPVLVIFFLGFGCVHCVEQLEAFGPEAEHFLEAGIELVAIGTDTVEQLKESIADDPEERVYPFPILSDAGLEHFELYRAFDDFEGVPLHGTYLIDGAGRVRWQDISYEPFMDWEFLLDESVRLLGLPEPTTAGAVSGAAPTGAAGTR